MLRELRIRNLAIIDDLRLKFEGGFNVLTGETGAGKSIIVDSFGLVLGNRAQSDLVRSGAKEASVQAFFEVKEMEELSNLEIDISDGLILRRSISGSGKSRAYINDTMVSLQTLTEVGRSLVEIHGQHEHQSLLSIGKQMFLVDSFGKLHDQRAAVASLYKEVQALKHEEEELRQRVKERAHRLDLLRFQICEIEAASLREGEKEELIEKRNILSNLTKLTELSETAYAIIYGGEGSCIEKLSLVISKIKEMALIDTQASEVESALNTAYPLIEEASLLLRNYKSKCDHQPEDLADIEDRIDLIKKLERKYGEGITTILRYKAEAEEEMRNLELVDERLDEIEAERENKEEMLFQAALSLSRKRRETAKALERSVNKELKELAFHKAEFVIDIAQDSLSLCGIDRIEFLFSANPGEPPRPLRKIASGGELSRVMLALKSILADFDNTPILIFDEVDAGIGGRTAEEVGRKLKAISRKHQVLCSTHLPQIASLGNFHLKVEKEEMKGRACITVRELSEREKIDEIARMLSGKITEGSIKHAKELLESAV
ncbi:MAG: DNA repair protein RecN [Nitrospirota bacterium]